MPAKQRIAIVGGGIAGLAAAWQLNQLAPDAEVVVFEASQRLGGFLQTESIDGYLIDTSADMFSTEPPMALELCRQLGHVDELIGTLPVSQRAYIATGNGICPVPTGFSLMLPNDVTAVLASPLLDDAARTRFLQEQDIAPKSDDEDESLQSFAVRRFGRQVFERLIQPLVSGIYTADPQRLSMQATMKRFVEMERKYGSLTAAARAARMDADMSTTASVAEQSASGARYDLFRAPERGMGQLIEWLAEELTQVRIRTGAQVASISRLESGWQLRLAGADAPESFEGLILATSAGASAKLLSHGGFGIGD